MTSPQSKSGQRSGIPVGVAEVRSAAEDQLKLIDKALGNKLTALRDAYDERLKQYVAQWQEQVAQSESKAAAAEKMLVELKAAQEGLRQEHESLKEQLAEQRRPPADVTERVGEQEPPSFLQDEHRELRPPPSSELVQYLEAGGCEVIDKRPLGGALWVVGSPAALRPVFATLKARGIAFTYTAGGSKATGGRPGWFTKVKG